MATDLRRRAGSGEVCRQRSTPCRRAISRRPCERVSRNLGDHRTAAMRLLHPSALASPTPKAFIVFAVACGGRGVRSASSRVSGFVTCQATHHMTGGNACRFHISEPFFATGVELWVHGCPDNSQAGHIFPTVSVGANALRTPSAYIPWRPYWPFRARLTPPSSRQSRASFPEAVDHVQLSHEFLDAGSRRLARQGRPILSWAQISVPSISLAPKAPQRSPGCGNQWP